MVMLWCFPLIMLVMLEKRAIMVLFCSFKRPSTAKYLRACASIVDETLRAYPRRSQTLLHDLDKAGHTRHAPQRSYQRMEAKG